MQCIGPPRTGHYNTGGHSVRWSLITVNKENIHSFKGDGSSEYYIHFISFLYFTAYLVRGVAKGGQGGEFAPPSLNDFF